jgi:predicted glycosyltransferase involved in capsule biosynthesis
LQSFVNLDYPRNKFELILVDDGSVTKEKLRAQYYVKQYEKLISIRYKYIKDKNWEMRVNKARNLWVKLAKHEILIFVDGDCLVPDYYLKNYNSYLEFRDLQKEIIVWDSIGYNYEDVAPVDPKEILKKNYNKYLFLPKYRDFRRIWHYEEFWHVFLWWNFCIHKNTFADIWGWDENIVSWWEDDIDFSFRAHKKEYSFSFLKRIELYNVKDEERMTRERFHSTLKNQCYVYQKHSHAPDYLLYVRQRFIHSELEYKKNNIPRECLRVFFENNFFIKNSDKEFLIIAIYIDDVADISIKDLEYILQQNININIIWTNEVLFSSNITDLKNQYTFRISLCSPNYFSNIPFIQMNRGINFNWIEKNDALISDDWPIRVINFKTEDVKNINPVSWEKLSKLKLEYLSLDELQTHFI